MHYRREILTAYVMLWYTWHIQNGLTYRFSSAVSSTWLAVHCSLLMVWERLVDQQEWWSADVHLVSRYKKIPQITDVSIPQKWMLLLVAHCGKVPGFQGSYHGMVIRMTQLDYLINTNQFLATGEFNLWPSSEPNTCRTRQYNNTAFKTSNCHDYDCW